MHNSEKMFANLPCGMQSFLREKRQPDGCLKTCL